jgi:hypothetical protein
MPAGLIEEENSVSGLSDFGCDLIEKSGSSQPTIMAFTIVHGHALVASRTDRCHLRKCPTAFPVGPTPSTHPARLRHCYRFLHS